MTGNSSANDGGLIVDPVVLANIQRLCRERAAQRSIEGLGLPQSDFGVARVPPPFPPLPGSFWQAVLYGNLDSSIPGRDATQALYLLSAKLGIAIAKGEIMETLRAGQLRKMLRDRFGPTAAEGALATLWRAASSSERVQPAEDQSRLPSGPFPVGHAQPAWIRDLNDPDRCEREWLLDHGIG